MLQKLIDSEETKCIPVLLHNLHDNFLLSNFFFLLKLLKKFASLYSGGRFAQGKAPL